MQPWCSQEPQQPMALPLAPAAQGASCTQDLQLHREDLRISRSRAASSASFVPIQSVPAFSSKASSVGRVDNGLKHIANIPLSTQHHYCTQSLHLPDLSYPCYSITWQKCCAEAHASEVALLVLFSKVCCTEKHISDRVLRELNLIWCTKSQHSPAACCAKCSTCFVSPKRCYRFSYHQW